MLSQIVINYCLTILIEGVVLILFKERKIKFLLYSLLVNAITNIPLNIFILSFDFANVWYYVLFIIASEISIVFIEACLYYFILKEKKKAFILSLVANASSYFIGLIISLIALCL